MPITRKFCAAVALLLWMLSLLFIGSQNMIFVTFASIFLGFVVSFDIGQLGVFYRLAMNKRSKPIIWNTVSALMPRDGHEVDEDSDVVGVILDVVDLRLKKVEISK
jgi:hypothetical protein